MNYYKYAKTGASQACALLNIWLSPDDFEDAVQAAALGVWKAEQSGRARSKPAYFYGAARREAVKFIVRELFAHNPLSNPLSDEIAEITPPDQGGLAPDMRPQVWRILYNSRQKRGQRGASAATRDMVILDLRLKGYSDEAIAAEIGSNANNVRCYRQRIRDRLKAHLANKPAR